MVPFRRHYQCLYTLTFHTFNFFAVWLKWFFIDIQSWSSGCQLSSSPFCWLSSCWPVLFIYLSLLASPAWHFPFNLDCTVFDRSELCCPIYVFFPLLGVLCLYSYVRPVVCVALYLLCFTTCVFIGFNTRHFNVLFNIWAETTEKICHLDP